MLCAGVDLHGNLNSNNWKHDNLVLIFVAIKMLTTGSIRAMDFLINTFVANMVTAW